MLCTAVCPEIAAAEISGMAFAVLAFFVQGESVVISGGMHQFVDCFPLGGVGSGYDVDGATFRTCAGRSSDTVNIVFGTLRQIIVDNMLNMRNVQSSRGNVGCYQNTVFLFPKIRNDFLPQALFQIAVNGAGRQRKFVQFSGETFCAEFCFDENQNRTAACGKLGCQLIIFLRSICFDDFLFDFPERRFGLNQ